MAGGSPRHNLIVANVSAAMHALLRDRPCVVLSSDQRVYVEETGLYTYPDVTVVCGALQAHRTRSLSPGKRDRVVVGGGEHNVTPDASES